MIEATCAACGTLNRVADGDVPLGAKFVTCASCKSRIAIPTKTIGVGALPPLKPPGIPGIPSVPSIPPIAPSQKQALPPLKPPGIPAIKAPPPTPAGAQRGDIIDLADLPAPKRASALGPDASKPAPRSGLAAAEDLDLPAPKSRTSTAALELDDLLAPVSTAATADLPAPKRASSGSALGDALAAKRELDDLPTPKRATPITDLPAPKRASAEISDLPAPKRPAAGIIDLPAPKSPAAGIVDLPAPKRASAGIVDLPAPKSAPAGIIDLPMPKPSSPGLELDDLPMPKPGGASDLPAPKGFFDDLPQPALHKPSDEIAPKGFFDDLPQAKTGPRTGASDLPAPKGFFDDLPQAKTGPRIGASDLPAPKGFFDDLPQPAQSQPSTPAGKPSTVAVEPPGPKGFFDDLPESPRATLKPSTLPPAAKPAAAPISTSGLFGDIGLPSVGPATTGSMGLAFDDGPSLDLSLGPTPPVGGGSPPSTTPPPLSSAESSFNNLELGTASPGGIRFDSAKSNAIGEAKPTGAMPLLGKPNGDVALELAEPRPGSGSGRKLPTKRADTSSAADPRARAKRVKIIGGAVLAIAIGGGGGTMFYLRHAAAQERADDISAQLGKARAALVAADPTHWQRAVTAAKHVLELDDGNPDALGVGAEAAIAGALDDGQNATARLANGRKMIADALAAGVTGPALQRAQAIAPIAGGQAARAADKLKVLIAAAPKDPSLSLYLGWAQLAAGDAPAAITALDTAAAVPAFKVPALYARGRAKLATGDLVGARADFGAVLEVAKDHIGAQVGLAAAQPTTQAAQQEADLLAILQRQDIKNADPRAVVQAWVLAGDDAKRGGRLDAARDRYHKALAITANDITATVGLAEVELRDKKIDNAAELAAKALSTTPDSVAAQLISGEVAIKQGKLDDADAKIKALATRTPPLTPLETARLQLLTGHWLEAKGQPDAAVDAYLVGAKAVGELDLAPTMAAVATLTAMEKLAIDNKNAARATELHDRADALLGDLAAHAESDPTLALTLGSAYMQVGDAGKAEPWLRKASDARPSDAEALFQLAKALSALGRTDDAMTALGKVVELDHTRADVALELARTYEAAGRDADAGKLYTQLVASPDASVEMRARAGRFWARTGHVDLAAPLGDSILAVDPDNAAGEYLRGEGLLAAGKLDEASHAFQLATDTDHDPQYYDGQGRAAEARAAATHDTRFQDVALRAYAAANGADPKMYNPIAGQGRLYVVRREFEKAVPLLAAAIKVRADDPVIALDLGIAYQELKIPKSAIQWLQRANEIKPSADASYRLGTLYFDANQGREAAHALTDATRLALDDEKQTGTTIPWLTDALYQLGRIEQATDPGAARVAWAKFLARPQTNDAQTTEVRAWLQNNR